MLPTKEELEIMQGIPSVTDEITSEEVDNVSPEDVEEVEPKKRGRGNPKFYKGMAPLNPAGKNQYGLDKITDKPTNRQLREKALLELARKLRPYQTKAIQAVVKVLDNPDAADQNKLKAASMMVMIYKDLLKDIYNKDYDDSVDDAPEELNQTIPTFSLRMINTEED